METKFNEQIKEYGLYATKDYAKGQIIYMLNGPEFDKPTKYTIHIGDNVHILDDYGKSMNHSFSPSTFIDGKNVTALVNIKVGDELTFNYNASELKMDAPFVVDGVLVCGKSETIE